MELLFDYMHFTISAQLLLSELLTIIIITHQQNQRIVGVCMSICVAIITIADYCKDNNVLKTVKTALLILFTVKEKL